MWEDELDSGFAEEDKDDLVRRAPATSAAPVKRKERPPPTPSSSSVFNTLIRPLLRFIAFCLTPLGSWFITLVVPLALVAFLTWFGVTTLRSALSTSLQGIIPSSASIVGLYCSTVGVGCPKRTDERVVASAARQATARASVALDVFQSFLKLGSEDSHGLALHPVE